MTKNLALFDFDGTITRKDTFPLFLYSCFNRFVIYILILFLSPLIILQKLGWIREGLVKELILSWFFKNTPIEHFNSMGQKFANHRIPEIVRKSALAAILKHKENGDRVYIVTASLTNWVSPWADTLGIEVIGTKVELQNGKLTGKLLGKNCIKEEKVVRIQQIVNLKDFDEIYAYGDSAGDRELLQIATKPHYRFFTD